MRRLSNIARNSRKKASSVIKSNGIIKSVIDDAKEAGKEFLKKLNN